MRVIYNWKISDSENRGKRVKKIILLISEHSNVNPRDRENNNKTVLYCFIKQRNPIFGLFGWQLCSHHVELYQIICKPGRSADGDKQEDESKRLLGQRLGYLASWSVMMEWGASWRLCWNRPGFLWWPPRRHHGSFPLSECSIIKNQTSTG